ncbi:hypothetical protein QQ991_14390 [Weizmannia coagulans]|uniref:Uncharacterized protein n=2 Tax=Heyndrickxia TaxID=2837504 RepID=A0A0C5C1B2_HEYCO|nr:MULTISPECIES: hypothetical protein [Heyndrickxia]AJO22018.1 hypothetical protein SB48_HM08orf01900 [Heyndrickxia coagulans]AKN56431.1 hypothetical protein AB434_4026 [Heyndrickxia coagulans]ATW82445.1 hypothetical protein CIW84_05295 [Heyndrickxia coagulans]AWP37838.1 hypothetical protein CYJ15_13025 [Heyndrickxia coagulans]KGB29071.1 hypothetical protein IE89_13555 [Heyndrickxia coagulans]
MKIAFLTGIVALVLYVFIAGIDFYMTRDLISSIYHPIGTFDTFYPIEKGVLMLCIMALIFKITIGVLKQKERLQK